MALAFADLKLVAEPSGAAALAAVLAGRIPSRGRTDRRRALRRQCRSPRTFAAALDAELAPTSPLI